MSTEVKDTEITVANSDKEQVAVTEQNLKENAPELSETQRAQYDGVAAFLAEIATRPDAEALLAPWTPEEEKRVVRKIDWIIIPMNFFQQILMAVDKVVMGTAALFTFRADLGLVGQDYSWANSIVYFGIIASMFPQAWLCQKYHIGYVQGLNVIGWAITGFATAGTKNKAGLFACRFLLGGFEGVGHTGVTLVIGMFYRKSEQPLRAALSYTILSSAVLGIVGYALQFYSGPVPTWRLLYIVFSAVTLAVGVLVCILVPSAPHTAWWLNDRQKVIAVRRLSENQTGVVNRQYKGYQVREAFFDPKTWIVFLIGALTNVPNAGLGGFYTLVVHSMGFSTKETTLLNIPSGIISQVLLMFFSWLAGVYKYPTVIAALAALVPFVGALILTAVPRSNIAASLVGLYMLNGFWACCILMTSTLAMANVAGNTKKATVYSITWIGYCVGNLVAPQTFIAKEAPKYQSAIAVMLASFSAVIVLVGLYAFMCWRDNRTKALARDENEVANHQEGTVAEEWQDHTDKENPIFVYRF